MLLGTALMGVGVALVVRSHLGLVPLDVLHTAVAGRAGWTLGGGIIAVQAILLALWVPLRIRPGPATVCAAVMPGITCDVTLAWLPDTAPLAARVAELAAGGLTFAVGVALYLGAGLGANPRDGIIQHLHHHHGHNLATVRAVLDVTCLAGGWLLLGPVAAVQLGVVGVGSVVLAVTLGPVIARLRPLAERVPGNLDGHRPE
jgi:uncharacterized membrane protein YczE